MTGNKLAFILFCLCLKIKPPNAQLFPEQNTISLEDSDLQQLNKSSQKEVKIASYSVPENSIKTPDISVQAAVQDSTNASRMSPGLQLTSIPLSLSLNSIDDMYYGCAHRMLIKVTRHYLPRSTSDGLHSTHTKLCAIKAMQNKDFYDELSWNHFKALCAYTAGAYGNLNRAVREGKPSYKTSFGFHALHFLLSDAIRLLKLNQKSCYTTFRRSRLLFIGEQGQTIRFGSFASSSLNKELRHFGRRTCFEIRTCFGAYLKSYSEFDSDEDEVLIPPYEMFSIVSADMSRQNHLHCDAFYKLETAGIYSGLNCQAVYL